MDPKKVANILHEGAAKLKALENPNKYYGYSVTASVKEEPSFEPNSNLGEGEASEDEMDYRTALLALLAAIFPQITKIVKDNKLTTNEKTSQIDSIIDNYAKQSEDDIKQYTQDIYDKAVTTANSNLKKIDPKIKTLTPDFKSLDVIQTQQIKNIESVSNQLKGKLIQGLLMGDINNSMRKNPEKIQYEFIDGAFKEAQDRLDGTGWYGWYKSKEGGLLSTYMMGNDILGALVADWITAGDENVCEDCQAMADNGPYSVLNWPPEQHFGDRCEMGEPYLLDSSMGVTV